MTSADSSAPFAMSASDPSPKIGDARAPFASRRSSEIYVLTGASLLILACWRGVVDPQARALVLCLLALAIATFGMALFKLRRPTHEVRASGTPTGVVLSLTAPPAQPVPDLELPAQPAAEMGIQLETVPAILLTPPCVNPASSKAPELAALIDAPLADLLLAALCKDPVGARLVFARALESSGRAIEPVEHAAPDPASRSACAPAMSVIGSTGVATP